MIKNMFIVTLICFFLIGCTERTPLGRCIGMVDEPNPKVHYYISKWNMTIGVIFSQTLIIPLYILLKDYQCPEVE